MMNSELFLKEPAVTDTARDNNPKSQGDVSFPPASEETRHSLRDHSLDRLRLLAIVLVVLTHVSAQWLDAACTVAFPVLFFTELCNILSFAGVTLFAMLSGALFLAPSHREKSCSVRFMAKHSLHFFFLYLFWKVFYLVEDCLLHPSLVRSQGLKDRLFLAFFRLPGKYHLWYLPMLCVLLLLVPLIYDGAQKKNSCILYLLLFFVTAVALPSAFLFEFPFKYLLMDFRELFDLSYFLGYLGYFLLGHVLYQHARCLPRKALLLSWLSAVIFLAAASWTASLRSAGQEQACSLFSTPFVLNTFLLVLSIFLTVCRSRKEQSPAENRRLRQPAVHGQFACQSVNGRLALFSRASFGVYLLHPLVLDLLTKAGWIAKITNPLLGIPVLWVLLSSLSFLVSLLLLKVPGLHRLVS